MRLRTTLLHIAALASSGCGGSVASSAAADSGATDSGTEATMADGSGGDSAVDTGQPEVSCGGCGCNGGPPVTSGNASADQACSMAQQMYSAGFSSGLACQGFCSGLNGGSGGSYFCTLPQGYVNAYLAVQSDAGDAGGDASADAASDGGPECPAWSGGVAVTCGYNCTGRRTAGVEDASAAPDATTGQVFAARAYLEAVSVHAFATLERELQAHRAPAALLRDVRRARRDEVRHTAMTARLSRRFGAAPRAFRAPPMSPVRGLFAIAVENAVEGCVRETYGAVVGLVEARGSRDAQVRRAMRSIAADECRHAELAWAVAEWIALRLTAEQRAAIDGAMRAAVAELAEQGDARVVALLADRVWGRPGSTSLAA